VKTRSIISAAAAATIFATATLLAAEPPLTSEAAVIASLKWLAEQQHADGSWSFRGDFANPGKCRSKTGATGIVLLPLLCADYTRLEAMDNTKFLIEALRTAGTGPDDEAMKRALNFVSRCQNLDAEDYITPLIRTAVRKGTDFLIEQMKTTSQGGDLRGEGGELLWQAMATWALCKGYGGPLAECGVPSKDDKMLQARGDKKLRGPAQQAIDFVLAMQDPKAGGWAPRKGELPSTVLTAWQISALKSGHTACLDVPHDSIKDAIRYLDSVQVEKGARYGETCPQDVDDRATAAALLMRMYLGRVWKDTPLEIGVAHISEVGPSRNDVVYNYFGQYLQRHWGGQQWREWNTDLRGLLVNTQQTDGAEAGSWFNPNDVNAADGGRLFQTALNTLILEIYHQPIRGRGGCALYDDDPE
jgi:hypothetical protein